MATLCTVDKVSEVYPEITDMLNRQNISMMVKEINILVTCSVDILKILVGDEVNIALFVNGVYLVDEVFTKWVEGRFEKDEEVRSVEIYMVAGDMLTFKIVKFTL